MARFVMRGILASAALAALGCNPADFSDLADQTWVHVAEAPGAPVGGMGPVADSELMVAGTDPIGLTRFVYDRGGGVETRAEGINNENFDPSASPLFASRPDDGGFFMAVPNDANNGGRQSVVGDFGGGVETVVTNAVPMIGATTWAGFAVSTLGDTGRRFAGFVADSSALEVHVLPGLGADGGDPTTCTFPATGALQGDPTPNATVGVLGSTHYVIGSSGGLIEVSLPEAPETECVVGLLNADVAVDGPILVGNFDAMAEVDIVGVRVGSSAVFLPNWLGPGTIGNPKIFSKPADASAKWGSAIAVGDFDGDGANDLAVGDPDEQTVYVYALEGNDVEPAGSLVPLDSAPGYGRALAAVPFGDKDLLVVATNTEVHTYFRIWATGDTDPRR